jgi:poly(3-hydroxybutyrate) depolymerase
MSRMHLIIRMLLLVWLAARFGGAQTRILDLEHKSKVFGETRYYRIFLPPDYDKDTGKRYPVIYFFHGWGERYNLGTREGAGGYDRDSDYNGDNIANFVEKNSVIVVKWDGYNPRTPGEKYVRPYNIGPVETYRQFPPYFPELVDFIDGHYRTIPDRDHRGVSGLSMGGFMAFWVGGKYPHLVGSVSNFMGSPEFMVGPKAFPSEYLHADMYRNYEGVRTRLVMGTKDFIRWYHGQMNRIWDFTRANYEHETFEWDHGTPGMAKQLTFHMKSFAQPLPKPGLWHHIDIYPCFEVWGYSVASDRQQPGFTVLENVTRSGFRSSVREWLWGGQTMPSVKVDIATDALYKSGVEYHLADLNLRTGVVRDEKQRADENGRLHLRLDGDVHEVGIVESPSPALTLARLDIENGPWAKAGSRVELGLHILNKGVGPAADISVILNTPNPGVKMLISQGKIARLGPGEIAAVKPGLSYIVDDPDRAVVSFALRLKDNAGRSWDVPFEVRLFPDVRELEDVQIADGRLLRVQVEGNRIEERMLGIGNGDGEVNPGESVVALVKDEGELRMASLYSGDACANPSGLNLRFSDYWGEYDHVGGSAKYSMPTIASQCPAGHELLFFAEYLVPRAPEHISRKGLVRIRPKGTDTTAPRALSADLSPGNILEVQIVEGGTVKAATATIVRSSDPSFEVAVKLNDSGIRGDRAARDSWFSAVVPDLPPGDYRATVTMADEAGNAGTDNLEIVRKN